YELEIPTLPKELAGINFVDIDLTLEVDLTQFKVFLADSVIVDNITITGTNDDGEEEIATISNQDVLINGTLVIEDPEDLINIRPTRVVISGQITIYPSDQPGTEVSNQIIVLTSVLHAPLILEINETSTFTTSPQKVIGDVGDQVSYTMTLFTEMDNQMEMGFQLNFLISPDTMNFEPNSLIIPDTLISIHLIPNQEHQMETIELGQDKYELLADSTYMKVFINLTGFKNNQGITMPTRFFTNDSLKVLLYSSTELLIDPQDRGRGE
ncbi:hypothetical protein KKF86_01335, partial [bacterium]|nr:hypothetical protein [bacterium]